MVGVESVLKKNANSFSLVLPFDLNSKECTVVDLSRRDIPDAAQIVAFNSHVVSQLENNKAKVGVGGYFEDRVAYRKSNLFNTPNGEKRTIHLGIDLWCGAATPISAFHDGLVHSFANNNNFLDYGPTIILKHTLDCVTFYTLYGHLSVDSLKGLKRGNVIKKGQQFANVGSYPANGGWPPHLHFQLMTDMLGKEGDYPGVAAPSEAAKWKKICLNPNLILQCRKLP